MPSRGCRCSTARRVAWKCSEGAAGFRAAGGISCGRGSPRDAASARSEMQDQPEDREPDASERHEKQRAVELQRESPGRAPGRRVGFPRQAPDRSPTKQSETATTELPPSRVAPVGSRIVRGPTRSGVRDGRIDIRNSHVSQRNAAGPSRSVVPVRRAVCWTEGAEPHASRWIGRRCSSHGISSGGVRICAAVENVARELPPEQSRNGSFEWPVRFKFARGVRGARVQRPGSVSFRASSISSDWLPTPSCR